MPRMEHFAITAAAAAIDRQQDGLEMTGIGIASQALPNRSRNPERFLLYRLSIDDWLPGRFEAEEGSYRHFEGFGKFIQCTDRGGCSGSLNHTQRIRG